MTNTSGCQGTNQSGEPCSATPQSGKAWCLWHDPDLAEQRKHWNREAGKAKSNTRRASRHVLAAARDLKEVDAQLCRAFTDVLDGRLPPGVGTAAATIARSIIAVREAGEIAERLDQLEATLRDRGSA